VAAALRRQGGGVVAQVAPQSHTALHSGIICVSEWSFASIGYSLRDALSVHYVYEHSLTHKRRQVLRL